MNYRYNRKLYLSSYIKYCSMFGQRVPSRGYNVFGSFFTASTNIKSLSESAHLIIFKPQYLLIDQISHPSIWQASQLKCLYNLSYVNTQQSVEKVSVLAKIYSRPNLHCMQNMHEKMTRTNMVLWPHQLSALSVTLQQKHVEGGPTLTLQK